VRAALFAALLPLLAPLTAGAQDLAGHGGPVRALAVLGDGGLASAGFDHSVILWDPAAGRARHVTRWHGGAVNALAALPGGGVASGGEDGRVAVWPPGGGAEPARVLHGHTAPVAALAAGPNGALASAGWDGTVRVWAADGTATALAGHAGPVNGLAWAAAGRLVSAGYDGTVRLWDAAAGGGGGGVLAEFGFPQNAALVLPGGAVASAGVDGVVHLVAPDGTARDLAAGSRPVVALAASPDGRVLAAASLGGSVGLWSVAEARLLRTLDGPGMPVWAVAFAADGRTLWTGGQDRVVRRWNADTGAPLGPLAPAAADAAAAAAPGDGDAHGARVFRACAACHALRPEGAANMAGPHLHGLFGRRMGSVPGYRYSERLARGDVVWTRDTVADLVTRGPDVAVPGTTMPVQRVEEAGDLEALLRFLEATTR
jgi:cytochrome c